MRMMKKFVKTLWIKTVDMITRIRVVIGMCWLLNGPRLISKECGFNKGKMKKNKR